MGNSSSRMSRDGFGILIASQTQRLCAAGWRTIVSLFALISIFSGNAALAETVTFGPPAPIDTAHAPIDNVADQSPDVAADGHGNWMAAWVVVGQEKLAVFASTDNGTTWQDISPADMLKCWFNTCQRPSVAAGDAGQFMVVWQSQTQGFSEIEVFARKVTRTGSTWSWSSLDTVSPITSPTTNELHHQFPVVAYGKLSASAQPTWAVVWNDDVDTGSSKIFRIAYSYLQSGTWTAPQVIPGSNYSLELPDLSTDGEGGWMVTWVTGLNDSNDSGIPVGLKTSQTTNLATPSSWPATPTLVEPSSNNGTPRVRMLHRPDSGPPAVPRTWILAWLTSLPFNPPADDSDTDIRWATSQDDGTSWQLSSTPINADYEGSGDASNHQNVTLATNPKTGTAVAVWEHDYQAPTGKCPTIDYAVGVYDPAATPKATWTQSPEPNPVYTLELDPCNSVTNVPKCGSCGDAPGMSTATDGAGTWLAVWSSYDPTSHALGTDGDILVSRSAAPTPTCPATTLADFLCYETLFPPFSRNNVPLVDMFKSWSANVARPRFLCAPADAVGNPLTAPGGDHLTRYPVTPQGAALGLKSTVTNRLGTYEMTLNKPSYLLAPAAKQPTGPVAPPSSPSVDNFTCYKLSSVKLVITDQFTTHRFGKPGALLPDTLCAPNDGPGNIAVGAKDHTEFLTCYSIGAASPFASQTNFVSDALGATNAAVATGSSGASGKPSFWCLPALLR